MLKQKRGYQSNNRQIILIQIKLLFFNMEFNTLINLLKVLDKMNMKTMNFTKNCKRLLSLNKKI